MARASLSAGAMTSPAHLTPSSKSRHLGAAFALCLVGCAASDGGLSRPRGQFGADEQAVHTRFCARVPGDLQRLFMGRFYSYWDFSEVLDRSSIETFLRMEDGTFEVRSAGSRTDATRFGSEIYDQFVATAFAHGLIDTLDFDAALLATRYHAGEGARELDRLGLFEKFTFRAGELEVDGQRYTLIEIVAAPHVADSVDPGNCSDSPAPWPEGAAEARCFVAGVFSQERATTTPVALYGWGGLFLECGTPESPATCADCLRDGGGWTCSDVCEEGACRDCVRDDGGTACIRTCEAQACTTCIGSGRGRECASLCAEGTCRSCVASGGGLACMARCS